MPVSFYKKADIINLRDLCLKGYPVSRTKALANGLSWMVFSGAVGATVLTVDPLGIGTNIFKTISAAVDFANLDQNLQNPYRIMITAGTYVNDYANVIRPMTLEAIGGAGVIMRSTQELPNQKGIVHTTASLLVDGIEFTGAFINNALGGNGAGIRDQITGDGTLQVENSIFRDNQESILTGGSNGQEHVIIKNSKFMGNGNASKNDGQEHALYVNDAATALVDNSVFCGQEGQGHNIKLRSASSTITNTQSYEGIVGGGCTNVGNASRGVDIPDGGILIMDNVDLFQGAASPNHSMMDFGAEGLKYDVNSAALTDVSFVSDSGGIGIQWFGGSNPCTLTNVTFTGLTTNQDPAGCVVSDSGGSGGTGGGGGGTGGTPIPEPGSLTLLLSLIAGMSYYNRLTKR